MTKVFMPHEMTLCLGFGVPQEGTLERLLGYLRSRSRLEFSRWDLRLHSCSGASSCHSVYSFQLKSGTLCFHGYPKEWLIVVHHNTNLFMHPRCVSLPTLWRPNPCGIVGVAVGEGNPENASLCMCLFMLVVHLLCSYKPLCGCFCLNVSIKLLGFWFSAAGTRYSPHGGGQLTFCWCLRHIFFKGGLKQD